jgi:hypothetical protein
MFTCSAGRGHLPGPLLLSREGAQEMSRLSALRLETETRQGLLFVQVVGRDRMREAALAIRHAAGLFVLTRQLDYSGGIAETGYFWFRVIHFVVLFSLVFHHFASKSDRTVYGSSGCA